MSHFRLFRNVKIQKKLFTTLLLLFLVPVLTIGVFLVLNTRKTLISHYKELVSAENIRVNSVLFDITTNIYNVSNSFILNEQLENLLTRQYQNKSEIREAFDCYKTIDTLLQQQASISQIQIYTNNPTIQDYNHFLYCDSTIRSLDWYQSLSTDKNILWKTVPRTASGYTYHELTLFRRISFPLERDFAVIAITVSGNYLKNRLNNRSIKSMACVNQEELFYFTDGLSHCHTMPDIGIVPGEFYTRFAGNFQLDLPDCDTQNTIGSVMTLQPYRSDDFIYTFTYTNQGASHISQLTGTCILIVILAVFIPCFFLYLYTGYFSARIYLLRKAMHQASQDDYNLINSFRGNDELSETFQDLQLMIGKIQEKDRQMYRAELQAQELINRQQELENRQQQIEFKMLASQINPHFLYNTLETIRMKAFNEDNPEVANAIKLLGRYLRYTLDTIGTVSTTLEKELYCIQLYLQIQKLRFKDRINYTIIVEPDVQPGNCSVLPFLLQPVVENAILHGLEKQEQPGQLTIGVFAEDDVLYLDVTDNGKGMTSDELARLLASIETKDISRTHSIGLYNINQRIHLCCGAEYGIDIISQENKGTRVTVRIPLKLID